MNILEFAKSYGFDFAKDTGVVWNGHEVYELGYNKMMYTGEPVFALVKNSLIKINDPKDTWEIYDKVFPQIDE